MHFSNILVSTDFSEISKSAFEIASYQAKMGGSTLTLVNIVEEWDLPPELRRVIWSPENISKMEKEYLDFSKEKTQ